MSRYVKAASAGMLAAVSIIFQTVHIGLPTQWGMWIDIVAVPWIIAYFLFGLRTSLLTAFITGIFIALADPSGLIGASLKLIATLPMVLGLALMKLSLRLKPEDFRKMRWILPAVVAGVAVRGMLVIPINYYLAIPLFLSISPETAMGLVPPVVMLALNVIQGVIDILLAWVLVFRFRLDRFRV